MTLRVLLAAALCLGTGSVTAETASGAVVLNEVNCEATDWVELVNTSPGPADISGWVLTDDPLGSTRADHRLLFAAPTLIPASGSLVVERGAAGFPFGISCGGDTLRLADAAGALVDEEPVPNLTSGADTWGRYPNGAGPWLQTLSTRGAPNEPSQAGGGPPPDLAAWLFDPGAVVEIDLDLPQTSINVLAADPEEYQAGSFSLSTSGGAYGPLDVGVRLKGGLGSFRPLTGKAAFKLKFSHSVAGQRFLGLKKLTLNNMVQDASMTHEVLAYEAFRAAGVAAPRTGYAFVRVNGDDYGLYLNLETLDDVSLPRWFGSTAHLYEGAYGNELTAGGAGDFEVDEGSESDRGDLEALIAAVESRGKNWSAGMAAVADLQQLTRMWAVERYVGHWDGYAGIDGSLHPNNYYLHSDASGRFSMLPWGTDQTWVERLPFDDGGGAAFERCLGAQACSAMYRDAVREIAALGASPDLDALAAATAALLDPWQRLDPRREQTLEEIAAAVGATRAFLAARPADAAAWLDPAPTPGDLTGARIAPSPETTIVKGPEGRVRQRRVRFAFEASVPGSSFECRLDREPFSSCAPPRARRVSPGPHTFRVRAIAPGGGVDTTPATARFDVIRRAIAPPRTPPSLSSRSPHPRRPRLGP